MKALPATLLEELEAIDGFVCEAFLNAHQHPAITSVRLHPIKQASVFKDAKKVAWCDQGLYLNERPVFTLDPFYHAGAYYVQEASSMFLDYFVKQIFPQRSNLRVLDLCGAPGGKSTLLAALLDDTSLLISNEVIRSRAAILEENITRWGYTNNWVTSNDPEDFAKLAGYFDLIVVDAPCSGSGLFRKDEKALEEWSEANVLLCSQRQQRILADVWNALKEDGMLIYATCSYSPQEDEAILDWIGGNFSVSTVDLNIPTGWEIMKTFSRCGFAGYRFFPDKVKGEGFFIAAVRKKEETKQIAHPKYKSLHDKKAADQSNFLLNNPHNFITFASPASKEHFVAIYSHHETDYHLLHKHLFLRKTGVGLGNPAGKDWIPDHQTALSIHRAANIPFIEVNKEQALKFLKKEEMNLNPLQKGWLLITYQGLALGWIKSLGSRINNYLPKHWRIRMELPAGWE